MDDLAEATTRKDQAVDEWLRQIVWAVEHDNRTISDVANVAGISRTQVRRMVAKILVGKDISRAQQAT